MISFLSFFFFFPHRLLFFHSCDFSVDASFAFDKVHRRCTKGRGAEWSGLFPHGSVRFPRNFHVTNEVYCVVFCAGRLSRAVCSARGIERTPHEEILESVRIDKKSRFLNVSISTSRLFLSVTVSKRMFRRIGRPSALRPSPFRQLLFVSPGCVYAFVCIIDNQFR